MSHVRVRVQTAGVGSGPSESNCLPVCVERPKAVPRSTPGALDAAWTLLPLRPLSTPRWSPRPRLQVSDGIKPTRLFGTNKEVKSMNEDELEQLPAPEVATVADNRLRGIKPPPTPLPNCQVL